MNNKPKPKFKIDEIVLYNGGSTMGKIITAELYSRKYSSDGKGEMVHTWQYNITHMPNTSYAVMEENIISLDSI